MNIRLKKKSKGFSLVELSISLVIIGMIASSALSVAVTSDEYSKISETNAKLDRIEEAVAGFLALNQRIPCPANLEDALDSADFGLEGDETDNDCPNATYSNSIWTNVKVGTVPVRTLQLPDDFMFDGWGRRIKYMVDLRVTKSDLTHPGCAAVTCFFEAPSLAEIQIATHASIKARAHLVIFSHGANGHGAHPRNGGTTRINGFPTGNPYRGSLYSLPEKRNASLDEDMADFIISGSGYNYRIFSMPKDQISNLEYYDDIIRYKTKEQLIFEAGAYIFESECTDATSIVENPGTNDCTGAYDESACESFATEIYSRCIN